MNFNAQQQYGNSPNVKNPYDYRQNKQRGNSPGKRNMTANAYEYR